MALQKGCSRDVNRDENFPSQVYAAADLTTVWMSRPRKLQGSCSASLLCASSSTQRPEPQPFNKAMGEGEWGVQG